MAVMVQPSSFLPVKSKILLLTACPTKVCFSAFPYDSTLSYVSNTTFLLHWFVRWHHWGFAAPHSPNLTRHQRSSSVAAALQRHLRWLMMHKQHRRGWQRSRGKRCSCELLFDVSDVWRGAGTTPRGRTPCLLEHLCCSKKAVTPPHSDYKTSFCLPMAWRSTTHHGQLPA